MTSSEPTETRALQFTGEQWAFLRRMNHDVRTPLMTILGTCEMLADGTYGETSPKQQKVLERVLRNCQHLQTLLTHAMTYVRLKSNALVLQSEPVAISEFLNNLISQSRDRTGAKELTFDLVIMPGMAPTIVGDPDLLALIIRELINNAVNFTPSGSVSIQLEPDGDYWKLTIQDTGTGVTSEDLAKVFIPFWRGPDAKTYAPQGDGMGLTVVEGLIQAMRGTIDIQSQPGKGSCVVVRLPQTISSQVAPVMPS